MGTTTNTTRTTLAREIATLERMTPGQLRERYEQVFGEPTRSGNRTWLMRRIAWRLQCVAEGDLAERAQRLRVRALAMADDADLRTTPPRLPPAQSRNVVARIGPEPRGSTTAAPGDGHLTPGTWLSKTYKGRRIDVLVTDDGDFEFNGERFRSLSAVAREVTGAQWNGRAWFGLPPAASARRAKEATA